MKLIKAASLGRAHELAVKYVLEHGIEATTENNERTIETDELCIVVDDPSNKPLSSKSSKFKAKFLDEYTNNLIFGSSHDFVYDYHSRLFEYGDGERNQIQYIIEKLSFHNTTRRAIAITWNPATDTLNNDVPCLQLIQLLIRNGKLHMKVVFRSNDVLSAMGANMYALAILQKWILIKLNEAGQHLKRGSYTHIILVPHIYHIRDAADIPAFCGVGKSGIIPNNTTCKACGVCPWAKK